MSFFTGDLPLCSRHVAILPWCNVVTEDEFLTETYLTGQHYIPVYTKEAFVDDARAAIVIEAVLEGFAQYAGATYCGVVSNRASAIHIGDPAYLLSDWKVPGEIPFQYMLDGVHSGVIVRVPDVTRMKIEEIKTHDSHVLRIRL